MKKDWTDHIEPKIEAAVILKLARLDRSYVGARIIRRMRVDVDCGTVDVMLFPPESSPHKLVLVEAKSVRASDSASKVVGQLLMYYAGALRLGQDGLEHLRRHAVLPKAIDITQRPPGFTSAQKVTAVPVRTPERKQVAWDRLHNGTKLQPKDIALFVALDGRPKPSLCQVIERLFESHKIDIGVVVANVDGDSRKICTVVRPSEGPKWTTFCEGPAT
jgi:hypothetical protein